jgi:transcriptional regulator with XRE-family HTH domain
MGVHRVSDTTNIYEETPDLDTIGGRISRAREASGLTVKEVAWRLGVKLSTIHAWESDRSQPGAHRMNMLSGMLNVSVSWVLHGVGTGPIEPEDESDMIESVGAQLDRLKLLHAETGQLITRLQHDMDKLSTN